MEAAKTTVLPEDKNHVATLEKETEVPKVKEALDTIAGRLAIYLDQLPMEMLADLFCLCTEAATLVQHACISGSAPEQEVDALMKITGAFSAACEDTAPDHADDDTSTVRAQGACARRGREAGHC